MLEYSSLTPILVMVDFRTISDAPYITGLSPTPHDKKNLCVEVCKYPEYKTGV
jgi:hypothetical protein